MAYTPEYSCYRNMKQRCLNPNHFKYSYYGARGIKICERWLESFDNFYADMGNRPSPKHSIERKDNLLGYSPDNCIWEIAKKQMNNTRWNRNITFEGITLTVAEWADKCGLNQSTLRNRITKGWSIKDAINIPKINQHTNEKGQFINYKLTVKE